jgi:hypothetical protein
MVFIKFNFMKNFINLFMNYFDYQYFIDWLYFAIDFGFNLDTINSINFDFINSSNFEFETINFKNFVNLLANYYSIFSSIH